MINREVIGLENLPNIYIEKISLEQEGDKSIVDVTIAAYDRRGEPTWYRDDIENLKIKICLVEDDEDIRGLNSGILSLYSFAQGERTKILSTSDLSQRDLDHEYSSFSKTVSFSAEDFINLNVYAAFFIDNLGFGVSLFDKFYGPMTGEEIYTAGQINSNSGYFYDAITNVEYSGPVHIGVNGSYFDGSSSDLSTGRNVVRVEEANYKIESTSNLRD